MLVKLEKYDPWLWIQYYVNFTISSVSSSSSSSSLSLSLSLIGHISTLQPIHDGGEDKDVSTC